MEINEMKTEVLNRISQERATSQCTIHTMSEACAEIGIKKVVVVEPAKE